MPGKKVVKYFEVIPENVQAPCKEFTGELKKIRKSMEKSTEEKCKAILFYVPIVSRAGTDIEAALQKVDKFKGKNVALVVLHHTYDPESIVLDSSRAVNREKTITVDCLFHEDKGLLQCHKNVEAVKKVADWLYDVKHKKQEQSEKKEKKTKEKENMEEGQRRQI
ncbi:uncharacterized protein si:dkey-111e8.5 isoform X1 [Pangasianodon hypophthalmus]|nr:uncharacterized protein si:dkey-111e8.5 isoform X1 [Pangasianodon hypophthalmus]